MAEKAVASRRARLTEPVFASWFAREPGDRAWVRRDWKSMHRPTNEESLRPIIQHSLCQSGVTTSSLFSSIKHLWIATSKPGHLIVYKNDEIKNTLQLQLSIASEIFKQQQTLTDVELKDALQDLREARDEAREEEFPEPSDTAIANAERLLKAMYEISPQRFEVYPTPDGAIAVDAPGGYGRSFVVFCEATGGALCMLNLDDEHRSARYDATRTLPDGFVREALTELGQTVTRNR